LATYEYRGKGTAAFGRLPGLKNVAAWQVASDLSFIVYALVDGVGPAYWRLANQMRGAATSVSGNLAEGYCSGSLPNYIRYCHQARGSLGELGSYLQDCEREKLAAGDTLRDLLKQYSLATLFLDRLLQSLITKQQSGSDPNAHWIKDPPAEYRIDDDWDPESPYVSPT
jgi:four helix bundle protein